jgi:hypothetical protein
MNEITIKIQDLNPSDAELFDLNDQTVQSIVGGGPISAFASAFATTAGIGIYGLGTGQSSRSILAQQVAFGVPAFVGGFLIPGP